MPYPIPPRGVGGGPGFKVLKAKSKVLKGKNVEIKILKFRKIQRLAYDVHGVRNASGAYEKLFWSLNSRN